MSKIHFIFASVLTKVSKMFFDIVGILMSLWINFLETNQLVNLIAIKSLLF